MDLLTQLPAIRRERGGVVVMDRILLFVGWLAAGWAVAQMFSHDYSIQPGSTVYLAVLAILPAWIHVRLWPRMAWVSGDRARRDDLFMAGLATPRYLWALFRQPLWRALLIPMSVDSILLVGALTWALTNHESYGMNRRMVLLSLPGVLIALSFAALSLAGAADVFGRLCRGMARGNAVVLSVVWVFAATIAMPCLWFFAAIFGSLELTLGTVAGMTGVYLLAKRPQAVSAARSQRQIIQDRDSMVATLKALVWVALGGLILAAPTVYLAYESHRLGRNFPWDLLVSLGVGLLLICLLLAYRVAFAVHAYQYGRDD